MSGTPPVDERTCYKLTVAYDGTDFVGWQKQEPKADHPGLPPEHCESMRLATLAGLEAGSPDRIALRTVQAVLERAARDAAREPIQILGASRTDSGVHAHAQVAVIRAPRLGIEDPVRGIAWPIERGTNSLRRAMNARLPDDVIVREIEPVPDQFDPIADCVKKAYSYTIHVSLDRPLRDRRYVHHCWADLDPARMNEAAQHLIGEHDFASFAATGHGRKTTVRTVLSCGVTSQLHDDGMRIRIDICGTGFLWNMVRIIAGTLVEVGRGKTEPGDMDRIIDATDRSAAGPTLPPTGLCLERIWY